MPTPRKKEQVRELQDLFKNSQVMIFTDYRGLKVSEITNLRRQLRDKGVEYHVTKNTLTTLAGGRSGLDNLETLLDGPTAIAFVGDDIPGATKVLTDFARTAKALQIRGGLVGRSVLNPDQVNDLTKILPREQYIAKVMGSLQSPISGMVNTLSQIIRGVVNVLQARVDQMKEQGETEVPAPAAEASAAPAAETSAPATETPSTPAEAAAPAPEASTAPATPETPTPAPAATEAPAAPASTEAAATATEEAPAPAADDTSA
jgi:large subunit ribosomal protein L10